VEAVAGVWYVSVQEERTMTTAARLDLRLDARDKNRIGRAVALRGMAVSTFVRDAVLREADTAIAADTVVTLSERESRNFLAALDEPFSPNSSLKKAMEGASRLMRR
jgi:uncharacterized protein (DUF1778 family)